MTTSRIKDKKLWSTEKTVETIYVGCDGVTYDARATLIIESDGWFYISGYDFFDPERDEWVDAEENDWEYVDIKSEFEVEIENNITGTI